MGRVACEGSLSNGDRPLRAFYRGGMTLLDPLPNSAIHSPISDDDAPRQVAPRADTRAHRGALLNRLRAGVLGANDGLVVGVAGASAGTWALAIAGGAALVAGALSMAAGEYVSVSTQKDTERSVIDQIRGELSADPAGSRQHLVDALQEQGVPSSLSGEVADAMASRDELGAHLRVRAGLEEDEVTSPWQAAITSLVAFTLGGLIPLIAILATPEAARVPVTMAAVVLALALTGLVSSRLGESDARRATMRTIGGGLLAMAVTYGIGLAVGTSV